MFTVLMLRRRLSVVQWISLCVLIGGVVLVQIVSLKRYKAAQNCCCSTQFSSKTKGVGSSLII